MTQRLQIPTIAGTAAVAMIAQVLLPMAIDLIASVAIFGCGLIIGHKTAPTSD